MKIYGKRFKDILTINIEGEIDECVSMEARQTLEDIIDRYSYRCVVFDLSKVSFMDSTGIGIMMGRYKKLKAKKIPTYILNPSPYAEKIFTMTKLFDLMPKIYDKEVV